MTTTHTALLLCFSLLFASCKGQSKPVTKEKPIIDYIITNDYLSERNLTPMGGVIPSNYNKGRIDSLRNCFVEQYDDQNNIIEERYYNKIGILYHTNKNIYDSKNRLVTSIEIDEFKNDSCRIEYQYTDSLTFMVHRRISNSCTKDFLDFYYSYNAKGEKIAELLKENDSLIRRKFIHDISKNERQIKSYDQGNRLSTYTYKYNDKDLLIYEKRREWDYVIKGDYFETGQENDYLYKYDANGNWIERIKQNHCPPKKKSATTTNKSSKSEPPKVATHSLYGNDGDDCETTIKEKLTRKIYYR